MQLNRALNTAYQLAHATGVEDPLHIDAIIGATARKLADGLTDADAYDVGHALAKKLALKENCSRSINQMIERIRTSGNPLTASHGI